MTVQNAEETPNTGAPDTTQTPPNNPTPQQNPQPQEPNVTPAPQAPQNPAPQPTQNPTASPDLLAAINALPEKLAGMLAERNPKPTENHAPAPAQQQQQQQTTQTQTPGKKTFAERWFG